MREVGVEGSDCQFSSVPYLTITSDTGEFTVRQGIEAFPAIVKALDGLPAFPSLKSRIVLKRAMYYGREIIWSRGATEPENPIT